MARRPGGGDWGWFFPPAPPKLPPPERGIRVRKFGATWWGQRWTEALGRFGGEYSARLGRGRSYARQGRVHDLTVRDGEVTARVTGSRPTPYRVTLRVAPLADRTWARVIETMAARAVFAARLLAGEMPEQIDEAFRAARASLFPERPKDLATACSCPDWANPCKHVAAVHYVLGEAFDRDPFLLFELRGRSKAAVLAALRRTRATSGGSGEGAASEAAGAAATVALTGIAPERYDAFRDRVDDLRFHIAAPAVEGAIPRQLGAPPSWRIGATPLEALQPAVARAAALARDLALGTAPPGAGGMRLAGSPPTRRSLGAKGRRKRTSPPPPRRRSRSPRRGTRGP